eukprot:Awhi_evm1s15462
MPPKKAAAPTTPTTVRPKSKNQQNLLRSKTILEKSGAEVTTTSQMRPDSRHKMGLRSCSYLEKMPSMEEYDRKVKEKKAAKKKATKTTIEKKKPVLKESATLKL